MLVKTTHDLSMRLDIECSKFSCTPAFVEVPTGRDFGTDFKLRHRRHGRYIARLAAIG
jgi:hypothetical protein